MKLNKSLLSLLLFVSMIFAVHAKTYYINSAVGNDKNNGESIDTPWATLEKISYKNFKPGDQILLASGLEYKGSLVLDSQFGSKNKPIIISSYTYNNNTNKPHINAQGYLNGILMVDSSNIRVSGITITADGGENNPKKGMRCGILYTTKEDGVYQNITIENCTIKNVYFENPSFQRGAKEVRTANGTQSYGWGIRFLVKNKSSLKNVLIKKNRVEHVAHTGIKINGKIDNLHVLNNEVFKTGGPGMQFGNVTNGLVKENNVNFSGSKDDSRKWGRGSGMWTWGVDTMLIEHNSFRNANGPADSAGCHIDFNCKNIIVQYNVSENNAGGFAEILGNNWNCAYRYNVSINDGYRVKKKGVASQEGKIFWLSGFVGKDRKRHGPYNSYFYNNTIYVKSDVLAKMAVAKVASGALIANNIFYIEGKSKAVLGDQYQPQEAGEADIENVIFKNNLFLKEENWPEGVLIQAEHSIYGNPQFKNLGGKEIVDYTPTNRELIKNKGIEIPTIPMDKKGLVIGIKVENDILGNEISGLPDMGAIEMQ